MKCSVPGVWIWCSLVAATLAPASALGQGRPVEGVAAEREAALGQALAREVEASEILLNDQPVSDYLAQLSARFAPGDSQAAPLSLRVLRSRDVRSIVLPGGHVYLSAGLVLSARSEGDLVALLAHEIAHLTARHGLRTARTPEYAKGPIPLIFLGGSNGICTRFTSVPIYPLAFRSASARFEQEADDIGREFLASAGFDPAAMGQVFARLAGADANVGGPDERGSQEKSSPEFEAIKRRINRMMPPDAAWVPSLLGERN